MDERDVLRAQGAFYVATGLSPFVSRRAFEAVTGPKREWWLVQTVGAIVGVLGAGMLSAAARDRVTPEVVGVAAGTAGALAAVDTVYVARRRIRVTYLLDAAVEVAFAAALLAARRRDRDEPHEHGDDGQQHPR